MDSEQAGEETAKAIEAAVNCWVDSDEIAAKRVDGNIGIAEEELVQQLAVMVVMTAENFH